jgi:hypothetical protein
MDQGKKRYRIIFTGSVILVIPQLLAFPVPAPTMMSEWGPVTSLSNAAFSKRQDFPTLTPGNFP